MDGHWENVIRSGKGQEGHCVRGAQLFQGESLLRTENCKSRWSVGISSGVMEWDMEIVRYNRADMPVLYAGVTLDDDTSHEHNADNCHSFGVYPFYYIGRNLPTRGGKTDNRQTWNTPPPAKGLTWRASFRLDMEAGELSIELPGSPQKYTLATELACIPGGRTLCPFFGSKVPIGMAKFHSATILNVVVTPKIFNPQAPLWARRERDKYGRSALHVACALPDHEDIALEILRRNPQAARERDGRNELPLHIASGWGHSTQLVAALLDAYPEASHATTDVNYTPLHKACYGRAPVTIVQLLLASWPEAVKEKTDSKKLPLHLACAVNAPTDVLAALLAVYPEAVGIRDDNAGLLPLECLFDCPRGPSELSVELLLAAFPDAVKEKRNGSSQLETVLMRGVTVACVRLVLQASPSSIRERSQNGALPLHALFYSLNEVDISTFKLIFEAYPEAARESLVGYFPLHCALFGNKIHTEIVEMLLSEFPEALEAGDAEGRLPLHLLVQHSDPPMELVERFLTSFPTAASTNTKSGALPLEFAVEMGASVKVVKALLRVYPDSAQQTTSNAMSHLMCAVTSPANSVSVIRLLAEANPNAVLSGVLPGFNALWSSLLKGNNSAASMFLELAPQQSREKLDMGGGIFPLCHTALMEYENVFAPLLMLYPEAAAIKNEKSGFPLNFAVTERNCCTQSALALLAAHPAAVKQAYSDGNVPLLSACNRRLEPELVLALLKAWPDGARKTTIDSHQLPLHFVSCSQPLSVVSSVLSAWPDAAAEVDCTGSTALDLACQKQAYSGVLELLLTANPKAVATRNSKGRLPLHSACVSLAPSRVIGLLLEANPAAAAEADNSGYLPLHLACENSGRLGCDVGQVICLLVAAHPDAVLERDPYGKSVLYLLCEKGAPSEAILCVLRAAPSMALEFQKTKKLPVQVLITSDPHLVQELLLNSIPLNSEGILDASCGSLLGWTTIVSSTSEKYINAIEAVLDAHIWQIMTLANATDEQGRRAIDLATSKYRAAISSRIYLCGRYDIKEGPPEHASATSLVYYAHDHGAEAFGKTPLVALKLMRDKEHFSRELSARGGKGSDDLDDTNADSNGEALDNAYVVPILRVQDGTKDAAFLHQLALRHLENYPFMFVLEAGDRSLHAIIDHERNLPNWSEEVRRITRDMVHGLSYLHTRGLIHGDIKPRNVVRVRSSYRIIDLDAAARYPFEAAGSKTSTCFAPPELLHALATQELLFADPSFDMWGLGATLFQLLTGHTLVHATASDNTVDAADERALANWSNDFKSSHLKLVKDTAAMLLLSRLLSKDPSKRPTSAEVLDHPFLTGRTSIRFESQPADWDVFLSYRVAADEILARALYALLTAAGLRVWFDKADGCIPAGCEWRTAFCGGLCTSRVFIPLISRTAVSGAANIGNWKELRNDSKCDNMFLEQRLAVELLERKLLERCCPVFIGDEAKFAGRKRLPNAEPSHVGWDWSAAPSLTDPTIVTSVETELCLQLESAGLGAPVLNQTASSLGGVWSRISSFQAHFVEGPRTEALEEVVEGVLAIFAALDADSMGVEGASKSNGGAGSPVSSAGDADRLRRRLAALEAENATLTAQNAMLLQMAASSVASVNGAGGQ